MIAHINDTTLELARGDITDQQVDAIVNAANRHLAGGAGVDGAIHARGGPAIMRETRRRYPAGCSSGSAVISEAGQLPAKFVLHAVGPIWNYGQDNEADLLASAHRRCLELAVEHDCTSIAFPAISTGVYGYPIDQAARVALQAVIQFLNEHGQPSLVRFVLFDGHAYNEFSQVLDELTETSE